MKLAPLMTGLLIGTTGIAASAIGIQYYNKCKDLQEDDAMKRNRNFLIFILILSILATLGFMGFGFMKGKKVQARYAPMAAAPAATAPMNQRMSNGAY